MDELILETLKEILKSNKEILDVLNNIDFNTTSNDSNSNQLKDSLDEIKGVLKDMDDSITSISS